MPAVTATVQYIHEGGDQAAYHASEAGGAAATVKANDLVSVKRVAKDRVGELQLARFNAAHEWYYFPGMRSDETVLIKTYDSVRDGRNRFTIHTAFADPNSSVDAAARQSLETRCFVFY